MTRMRLVDITASACPEGNGIRLSWTNPDPAAFPGVRVVRRADTYPVAVDDGVVVAAGTGLAAVITGDGLPRYTVTDRGLAGGRVWYYTLFPYAVDPFAPVIDRHNRCAAMATVPHGFAGLMYELLPRIYHRYDTVVSTDAALPDQLRDAGQLRRFLEMPGLILDQLYSHAAAAADLHNLVRMDGRLLPLLARWIGWQIDYRLEIDAQRNEVRSAPHLYKTVGLIPTVEATVKRLTNWESRTKEFVHNIFVSNKPESLALWAVAAENGKWREEDAPLSLHTAYEGRPAVAMDGDGCLHLFYHAGRSSGWHIWHKSYTPASGWSAGEMLTEGATINKHPAAARQHDSVQLYWNSYDPATASWSIHRRTLANGHWSAPDRFGDTAAQRRAPAITADSTGGLWLFWRELHGKAWRLRYNRHDGNGWQLDPPPFLPDDGGQPPRVEGEAFVLSFNQGGTERLALFWSQPDPGAGPGQRRPTMAWRVKDSLNPNLTSDWGSVHLRPKNAATVSESDPAVLANPDGTLTVFFSSDEQGGWSIHHSRLDPLTAVWDTAEQITRSPYTERYPLPLPINGATTLLYRCNRGMTYSSAVFRATRTLDSRHAGSVTVTAANIAKNALHGAFGDFQAYTSDTGINGVMTDRNWYSRQTVGIYLTPDTEDPGLILRNQQLLRGVLSQFLPIQVRYVFIIEPAVYREAIYTYDFPLADSPRLIGETVSDRLSTVTGELYGGPTDSHTDTIPQWRWLRAWGIPFAGGGSVDFAFPPASTRFRTWHTGLTEGED
ncbi:MAG: hypothetical protein ACOY4H_06760 [Thermodesulfobacteriota bacterium]